MKSRIRKKTNVQNGWILKVFYQVDTPKLKLLELVKKEIYVRCKRYVSRFQELRRELIDKERAGSAPGSYLT